MKIAAIYTQSVGPLGDAEISFKNDWTEEVEENVLLTGPNGCGKSTLLRGIAMLWDALGFWLDREKPLPATHNAKKWLQRWETFAVVIDGLECSHFSPASFGLFYGDERALERIIKSSPGVYWVGETHSDRKKHAFFAQSAYSNESLQEYLKLLRVTRAQVVLGMLSSGMDLSIPNVVYLDAEERRWIIPRRNISDLVQDDLNQRWLATYTPTSDWKGQLEASLFNMKATLPNLYPEMMKNLNQFFSGKVIEEDIHPGQRQQVRLANGDTHTLDELSSGEHQVLIMLFMVQRWLQPGGVVLIDEPDLHLHPSLVSPLLATLENIIQEKRGQLILTSHATDVWQRYESLGLRYPLSVEKGDEQ
ncbi:TPA: AAA family ATPase [Yersinia enterocolitica]|uniref:AAA family ATPase n=1 Tax=Yersinia TaxID=629 RepID=UPI00110E4EA9|nr:MULTISPECIES: ATP-binding protein [Yersinia]QDW34851.1 AAA family ATPase [Yersinia sp. KBS0713]